MLYVITLYEHCQMTATQLQYKNIPDSQTMYFLQISKNTQQQSLDWNQYFLMMPIEVLIMVY